MPRTIVTSTNKHEIQSLLRNKQADANRANNSIQIERVERQLFHTQQCHETKSPALDSVFKD